MKCDFVDTDTAFRNKNKILITSLYKHDNVHLFPRTPAIKQKPAQNNQQSAPTAHKYKTSNEKQDAKQNGKSTNNKTEEH